MTGLKRERRHATEARDHMLYLIDQKIRHLEWLKRELVREFSGDSSFRDEIDRLLEAEARP